MIDLFGNEYSGAHFSPCRKYRYKLWRIWDETKPKAMCIGLNPSSANEVDTDSTITHLTIMLNKLGFGGFYMTNLFGWISEKPQDLLTCPDPIGDNENILKEVETICDEVIFCWGSFKVSKDRIEEVHPRYPQAKCFGFNADGSPFHPLAMMYKGLTHSPTLIPYHTG